jgi:hypothetical protein
MFPYFKYFHVYVKFSIEYFYKISLSNFDFRENRYMHYLGTQMNIYRSLKIVCPIWMKFGIRDLYIIM